MNAEEYHDNQVAKLADLLEHRYDRYLLIETHREYEIFDENLEVITGGEFDIHTIDKEGKHGYWEVKGNHKKSSLARAKNQLHRAWQHQHLIGAWYNPLERLVYAAPPGHFYRYDPEKGMYL